MGSVSIAVPFTDRWYFAELLAGARARVERAGHHVRLHLVPPAPGATAAVVALIGEDFTDPESLGAIAAGFKYQPDQSSSISSWQRPIVIIGGSVLGYPTVMIDDIGAARLAVEHLVELGHTRIVHFAGPLHHQMDFSVDGRRAKGYLSVMESAALQPLLIENDFGSERTYTTALELLSRADRPTAIFAVSDEVAFPVLAAARELGLRLGQQLAVVGIDDHPRAEAEGLTTVRQRPREMGESAADLLLSGLSHGPDPRQSLLHPIALIPRASTAANRAPAREPVETATPGGDRRPVIAPVSPSPLPAPASRKPFWHR